VAVFRVWLNPAVQIPVSIILYHRRRCSCMALYNSGSVVCTNDAKKSECIISLTLSNKQERLHESDGCIPCRRSMDHTLENIR
jgi:hypothetical protein